MGKLKIVLNRIYSDYLMPSRMDEYEEIIKKSLELGYEHITLKSYCEELKNNRLKNRRYFLHRHDVDTDLKTTKKFFEIEKKYNIKTTYYFRLSTLDINLMKEIDRFGGEASYHFEEISQFCKDNRIRSKEEVFKNMRQISELFVNNVRKIEGEGIKITTVASHGDFVNRKLGIVNNEILVDIELREKLGIVCEVYDPYLMESFGIYVSDQPYPVFYTPKNIFDVLGEYDVICMLTHPREWNPNWIENTKDNIKRVCEGLKY